MAVCLAIVALCGVLAGCGSSGSLAANEVPVLTATISTWSEMGGSDSEPDVLEGVKKGDVICDLWGFTLTVKKVTADEIVLSSSGGIIEDNEDGTINLNAKAPDKLVIKKGEEKHYSTQSMDGGINFTFSYDVKVED